MMRGIAIGAALAVVAFSLPATARDRSRPVKARGNPGDWFPMNSYPAEAKRNGQQGRVTIQLTIGKTGAPTSCQVVASSGAASLDTATCALAMANAKFTPAIDASGQPIEATFTLPGVRWELQDSPPIKLEGPWRVVATLQIDQAGKLASCSEQRSGPAPADVRLCLAAKEMPPAFGIYARDGSSALLVELVIETSLSFDGVPSIPMTYESDGRITLSMSATHFDVDTSGKAGNCQVQAQGGPNSDNLCNQPPGPFLPIDEPRGIMIKIAMSRPTVAVAPAKP